MANIARRVAWYAGAVALWFVSTQLELSGACSSVRPELARQTIYLVGVALSCRSCSASWSVADPQDASTPVLSYLGLVSYGIYLWHQAFLTWTHDLFGWGDFKVDFTAW